MKNCSDHGHIILALDAMRGFLVALHFEQTWIIVTRDIIPEFTCTVCMVSDQRCIVDFMIYNTL